MGRILSEKGGPSPKLAGPSEADSIPEKFLIDGEIPTWAKATHWFTSFVEYLENESVVAHKALNFAPFTQRWAGAAWSELYRVDQKACQWAESTVLIEFSGSYWLDKNSRGCHRTVTTPKSRVNAEVVWTQRPCRMSLR